MAAPVNADWDAIRESFIKGLSALEISRRPEFAGVKPATISQRAVRHNWMQLRRKVEFEVSKLARKTLQELGQEWNGRVADLMFRHLEALERKDPKKLTLRDFETLSRITAMVDKTGARAMDLENKPAERPIINIQLLKNAEAELATSPVDVTSTAPVLLSGGNSAPANPEALLPMRPSPYPSKK